MTHKKIWTLYKPEADYADATYIMGLGCAVEVIMPDPLEFETSAGTRWMTQDAPHIEIVTTCEKQESMLYLKYGDELRLKSIIHRKLEPWYADIDMVSHS